MSKSLGRILIVDDVKDMRDVLDAIVVSAGFTSILASSSEEMMKILNQNSDTIDLILLDIQLSDKSGITTLQELKKHSLPKMPKVCFISGSKDKSTVIEAIKAGGSDYIVKPVDPDTLTLKLMKLLDLNHESGFFSTESNLEVLFVGLPIKSNSRIIEISEVGFKIKTDLHFYDSGIFELEIPDLSLFWNQKNTFTCKIDFVDETEKLKVVSCSFSALHESISEKIRMLVLKKEKITKEYLDRLSKK